MNNAGRVRNLRSTQMGAIDRLENLTQSEKNFIKYDIPLIIDIQIKILKDKKTPEDRKEAINILDIALHANKLTDENKAEIKRYLQESDTSFLLKQAVGFIARGGRRRKTHKSRKSYRRKSRKN